MHSTEVYSRASKCKETGVVETNNAQSLNNAVQQICAWCVPTSGEKLSTREQRGDKRRGQEETTTGQRGTNRTQGALGDKERRGDKKRTERGQKGDKEGVGRNNQRGQRRDKETKRGQGGHNGDNEGTKRGQRGDTEGTRRGQRGQAEQEDGRHERSRTVTENSELNADMLWNPLSRNTYGFLLSAQRESCWKSLLRQVRSVASRHPLWRNAHFGRPIHCNFQYDWNMLISLNHSHFVTILSRMRETDLRDFEWSQDRRLRHHCESCGKSVLRQVRLAVAQHPL